MDVGSSRPADSAVRGGSCEGNGWGALNFYWSEQGRQVRVRGRVLPAGPDRSAADFLARSDAARAEALAGTQSEILSSQADLEDALRDATQLIELQPQTVVEAWSLYGLAADEVEFWQAHPERRHVRVHYLLRDGSWSRKLLWP